MKASIGLFSLIGILLIIKRAVTAPSIPSGYDETNFPTFRVDNADFPDKDKALQRIEQAFKDMLEVFRVACVYHTTDAGPYFRYLEHGIDMGPDTVLSIVCEAAGIKESDRAGRGLRGCLLDKGPVNPKYKHWEIWAGKATTIPKEERPHVYDSFTATTYQEVSYVPGRGVADAITELYPRAFDFLNLDGIYIHRGLKGLGSKDSGLMTSLGAQLVHEAFHWRFLCVKADGSNLHNFDRIIDHTVIYEDNGGDEKDQRNYIDDYTASDPKWHEDPDLEPDDGYGPAHTRTLVVNKEGDSYRNADNYRWYVVSLYWNCVFHTIFEEQDNNNSGDKMVPKGVNGQVPFPGEKPPAYFLDRPSQRGNL